MKRMTTVISILVVAAFALAACSPTALSGLLTSNKTNSSALAQQAPTTTTQTQTVPTVAPVLTTGIQASTGNLAAMQSTLEQLYSLVSPSVVYIEVTSTASSQGGNNPFGFGGNGQNNPSVSQALGSGFVWDTQGHIVTNNHVVDGASQVTVTFSDGFSVPAKVVGTDVNSDLAVIQVTGVDASRLHPVTLGDSSSLKVGQLAIAIGNPFGLSNTMTMGIISALSRSLPVNNNPTGATTGSYTIPDIIQTDAPINPGNSGGVLINDAGQVVGVTSAIESNSGSNAGIGFAIPASIVSKVVPSIISKGSYQYSYLGISGASLDYNLDQAMGLKTDQRGALVAEVTQGGPAAQAGIQGSTKNATINGQQTTVGGDIITAIDNQPVNTFDDLVAYLVQHTQPGQKVTLTILRNGNTQNVEVTLAERPANAPVTAQNQNNNNPFGQGNNNPFTNPFGFGQGNQGNSNPNAPQGTPNATNRARLGITGIALDAAVNQAAGLPANLQGVLVEQVQNGSPAANAGLQGSNNSVTVNGQQLGVGGDVITAINGTAVASVQDLQAQLQNLAGQTVTLTILRNGQQMDVKVNLAG